MKTVFIGVLLALLSIGAHSGFSDALSGSGRPLIELPGSPSVAASPPELDARVGAIALEMSGSHAPSSTRDDNDLAARLPIYVMLHQTRGESVPFHVSGVANVCLDDLRGR